MEIARIFFSIALFSLGVCWLCNIMMLFTKPHKWCELLIFPQLVWFALGIIVFGYGEIYFDLQTKTQWYLVTYGYPFLLLPIQFLACNKFVSLYQKQKQDNVNWRYSGCQTGVFCQKSSLFLSNLRTTSFTRFELKIAVYNVKDGF